MGFAPLPEHKPFTLDNSTPPGPTFLYRGTFHLRHRSKDPEHGLNLRSAVIQFEIVDKLELVSNLFETE